MNTCNAVSLMLIVNTGGVYLYMRDWPGYCLLIQNCIYLIVGMNCELNLSLLGMHTL
jgi:hypothetical protein